MWGSVARWVWAPLILVLGLGVWAAAHAAHAADPVLARARARGYLVAAVPLWLPPFGAQSRGGAWTGLDVLLARAVAEAVLGSPERVHFLPVTPAERLWAVRSGAADFVAAAFVSAGPEPGLGLTLIGPYFTDPMALVVRRGQPVSRLADLDGQVVGVLPGSSGGQALRAAAGTSATPVLQDMEGAGVAAHDLALGRLRALVGGSSVCRALAASDPEFRVQPMAALGRQSYYVVAPAQSPQLAAAIRQAIAALPRGGALAGALAAWSAGADVPPLPAPGLLTPPAAPA